jgi:glycosyltransferase involved in cell wall biosynthesis
MKVQIISPLRMQWESKYKEIMPDAVWNQKADNGFDVNLFMWANEDAIWYMNGQRLKESGKTVREDDPDNAKNIIFLRRYEVFTRGISCIDWSRVDEAIMVNDYLADMFEKYSGKKPHVIYNGVDTNKWGWKNRDHGKKIAWVGFINLKKNFPLALQILEKLPKDYELYIAGGIQDPQLMPYIDNILSSMGRNVFWDKHIPAEHMDEWLDDKDYLLNTAVSEGCPNSVLEAMAKGIKPIVHNWPGSKEQFGNYVFDTIDEAVQDIQFGHYDSLEYISDIEKKFGNENYMKVRDLVYG